VLAVNGRFALAGSLILVDNTSPYSSWLILTIGDAEQDEQMK